MCEHGRRFWADGNLGRDRCAYQQRRHHADPAHRALEEADWDAVMDINVKGAYLFSRAVLGVDDSRPRPGILSVDRLPPSA